MRKLILSLFLVLALALPAHSGMTQYFSGGYYSALGTDQTYYNAIMAGRTWTATEAAAKMLIPVDGTLSNLYVERSTSGTATITVRQSEGDASLAASMSGTASASDINQAHNVDIARGDLIDISGTSTGGAIYKWSIQFDADIDNEGFLSATGTSSPTAGGTQYLPVSGFSGWSTALDQYVKQPSPKEFTARKLLVKVATPPGGSETRTFTLVEDGADTGWGCTITGDEPSCEKIDTGEYVAAEASLAWKCVSSNGVAATSNVYIAVVTDTGTNGESFILGNSGDTTTTDATEFNYVTISSNISWGGTESNIARLMAFQTQFKDFYAYTNTAPGVDETVAVIVREDGETSLTDQISGTGQTCSAAGPDTVAAGADINMAYTSSASAAAGALMWGFVQYNPVASGALPQVIINAW